MYMYVHSICNMLFPSIELNDGSLVAVHLNPAVSSSVLKSIYDCGIVFDDIIDVLRCRTVPEGHMIHNWKEG